MGIANIRALTYDKERAERSEATGDGTTVDFALPQRPVVDLSDSITDAGSAQTRGTDYTINNETGRGYLHHGADKWQCPSVSFPPHHPFRH